MINTKLVESLVQIIESLYPEEQTLLSEKLQTTEIQQNQLENYKKLLELRVNIFGQREGKSLEPETEEIIYQMRKERSEQLMQASFPELSNCHYQ